MSLLKKGFAITIVLALSGCAATVQRSGEGSASGAASQPVVEAAASKNIVLDVTGTSEMQATKDFQLITGELRSAVDRKLSPAGATVAATGKNATATSAPGARVVITVNDYRYVSAGARFAFGIMTGNAYLNAKVEIFDLQTGKKLNEQIFNTSSSAMQGIFSAMTDKQVDAVADEILTLVRPRG
jgi:hypothetical protein